MSGFELNDDVAGEDNLALERLLAYQKPLDGAAFAQQVVARALRAKQRRFGILGGAVLLSAVSAFALKPARFDFMPELHGVWNAVAATGAAFPLGALGAVCLAVVVVLGISRTVDGI